MPYTFWNSLWRWNHERHAWCGLFESWRVQKGHIMLLRSAVGKQNKPESLKYLMLPYYAWHAAVLHHPLTHSSKACIAPAVYTKISYVAILCMSCSCIAPSVNPFQQSLQCTLKCRACIASLISNPYFHIASEKPEWHWGLHHVRSLPFQRPEQSAQLVLFGLCARYLE